MNFGNLDISNLSFDIVIKRYDEVVEVKQQNDYAKLCEMILDLETLMVWERNKPENLENLVMAEYVQSHRQWKGRVNATTRPIEERLDKVKKILC